MLEMRKETRVSAKIRNLPNMFQRVGEQGRDTGCEKEQLVTLYELLINYEYTNFLIKYSYISMRFVISKQIMDTISNMLTQIRNAQGVGKADVVFPFSKIKMSIARILKDKGYVESAKKENENSHDAIKVVLKYEKVGANKLEPAISGIKRVSKLGKRIYIGKDDIKKVKNGYGISIISTSKGLMTGEEARKAGVGGEVICEVW